jgi:hypothetical protein
MINEWISVEDRLPDKSGDYIAASNFFSWAGGVGCATYIDSLGSWAIKGEVTHWQELPPPPNK